jgi:hypothetical protein
MTRAHLGLILEQEKLEIGVELGVQAGQFAYETLKNWKSAK